MLGYLACVSVAYSAFSYSVTYTIMAWNVAHITILIQKELITHIS